MVLGLGGTGDHPGLTRSNPVPELIVTNRIRTCETILVTSFTDLVAGYWSLPVTRHPPEVQSGKFESEYGLHRR